MKIVNFIFNSLHAWYFFLSSAVFFLQNQLFQNILSETPLGCQTVLDADEVRHFVGPDLGPNCLNGLSVDDKIRG